MPSFPFEWRENCGSNHLSDRSADDDTFTSSVEAQHIEAAAERVKEIMAQKRKDNPGITYDNVRVFGSGAVEAVAIG